MQSPVDIYPYTSPETGHDRRKGNFRLIVREEVEPGSDYAALSHCWGTKYWDPDLTLGASTLTDLSRGKPLSCLPKTFKDAFMALERLGLQYIWIDRLCILQDSEADWNRESSSMHNVFRSAFLCFAALGAENDEGGLYFRRDPNEIKPGIVEFSLYVNSDPLVNAEEISLLHSRSFDQATLCKRAWILQERVLSPRTIYWGKEQVFWEGHEAHCSESQPDTDWIGAAWVRDNEFRDLGSIYERNTFKTLMPRHPVGPWPTSELHYLQWRDLVHSYSQCQLTKPRDKLVAISAIAKQTRSSLEALGEASRYLAGIWEAQLPGALAWLVMRDSARERRPVRYRAPSWSWAAVDGEIMCPRQTYGDSLCELVSAYTTLRTDDETGQVTDGAVTIEGALLLAAVGDVHFEPAMGRQMKAETCREVTVFEFRYPELLGVHGDMIDLKSQPSICFDTLDDICAEVCFLPTVFENGYVLGPALVPKEGRFTRVGAIVAKVWNDNWKSGLAWLTQLPKRTVVIR
ncbi:hypothetical protein CGCFRS4_v014459 [Colletotrichum fructicola]|nr:hypothetical protein CGCFRS4_v014459 [Colletotrichum fructicola]